MKKIFFITLVLVSFGLKAQSTFQAKQWITSTDTLNYQILLPQNFSEEKTYPLVIFLHGAGERGDNNTSQLVHGSKLFLEDSIQKKYEPIVIFPQCPKDDYWANVKVDREKIPFEFKFKKAPEANPALSMVMDLVDDFTSKSFVKKGQVYIMGLSMGGMGTYEMVYHKPDTFAAAIAICGGAQPKIASNYTTTPFWIFHGATDNVVLPKYSVNMVSAILKNGGFPRVTIFEKANHNSWDGAFNTNNLLHWLFSHKKQIHTNTNK